MLQRLPTGISSFSRLRSLNRLYVDKTKYAYELITQGGPFFLARPRRFGKSLFVSMLKELLKGNKPLFKGLFVATRGYPFTPHGVIALDFSLLATDDIKTFKHEFCYALEKAARDHGLKGPFSRSSPNLMLRQVVEAMQEKFGHVAVLIDEYDAPILKTLEQKPLAKKIRELIRSFFTTLKGLNELVPFVFITGVSAFSKAGVFSGMNDLQIITLNPQYAGICGYTDAEVGHCLTPYIKVWAAKEGTSVKRLREEIRRWYNGYHFAKEAPAVYNPFSLVNALSLGEFQNFWFESGTPSFLVQELKREGRKRECEIFDLEALGGSYDLLQSFNIHRIPLPALLFQTGYLTLGDYLPEERRYTLKYPNFEVKTSLHKHLLMTFGVLDPETVDQVASRLQPLLEQEKIEEALKCLRTIFSSIPSQLLMSREQFYHALLQIAFVASGINARSESAMSQGRADLIVELPKLIYVFEVKFQGSARAALTQIERRRYFEPYLEQGKKIWLVGLAFQRKTQKRDKISAFEMTAAFKKL